MRRAARARAVLAFLVVRAVLAMLVALLQARPAQGALGAQVDVELEALAPRFVDEPATHVLYAAERGTRVACSARGDPPPTLRWLDAHGDPLHDAPTIRRVHTNGTLELVAGAGAAGGGVVRCRAENAHGGVVSRDVLLQPVEERGWRPLLQGGVVARGGLATLQCRLPAALPVAAVAEAELLWFRGDAPLDIPPPAPDSRLLVAGDTLLIRNVRREDAGEYSCAVRPPRPVGATPARSRPALLVVAESATEMAPRTVAAAVEQVVPRGAHFCLWCGAEAHPLAEHVWLRARGGGLQAAGAGEGTWQWAGGAALCARAEPALQGAWLCKASNARGEATRQLHVHVLAAPRLSVLPAVVVAAAGGVARFMCAADAEGDWALSWLHDGAPAGVGAALDVRPVSRAQRGVYQCVARNARGTVLAQAAAELRLGDSGPELVYTFIEQALRGGGAVSLRCVAAGAPPPRLAWLRDDLLLDPPRTHRYAISSDTTARGDVVSTLNVTAARAEDGGRYTCRAENRLGRADHSARLNIYGPPAVRAAGPLRVVAGDDATVHCPYTGYPISEISWWRRGGGGPLGGAGRVSAHGAALRLAPALAADAGHYTCVVSAGRAAPSARRDIEIQVSNPPKISPFMFSSELTEGSSAQVLCGVSSGDRPMYFTWLKDGAALLPDLQVEEKSLNEFSLLMFSELSARHAGAYTCRVSNNAAVANYTATLNVKVAPAWMQEPTDAAVVLGAPVRLACAARGHPPPAITWSRWAGAGDWAPAEDARGGTLETRAAARSLQAVYRCVADNGVGPPLIKHVNLTVHEPAQFSAGAGNVSSERGRGAALWCEARGDAPLTVHWARRGARLDLGSYRFSVSEERHGGALRSTLRLRTTERADAGEYSCHTHNHYGTHEIIMFLQVEEAPPAPEDVRLGGVGTRWVRVAWRTSAVQAHYSALCTALQAQPGAAPPHAEYNLTLERPPPAPAAEQTARLAGLRPAAAYALRLAASNRAGRSPHSEPVLFTTLEEAPSAPPQNVRVTPTGFDELHVSWSAPAQDSWNGEVLGYVARWREEGASAAGRGGQVTARGWNSAELTLSGLLPAERYAVSLRAYNRAGAGPSAPTVLATTLAGGAEAPVAAVTCEPLSGDSLRVEWRRSSALVASLRAYDVHYIPVLPVAAAPWNEAAAQSAAGVGAAASLTLRGLQPATNYSVWVRARAIVAAPSVPSASSAPVYCVTGDDVPGPVTSLRALAAGVDALLVTWLAPTRAASLTHYTLHARELGKGGSEWTQRVEAGGAELMREVRPLRAAVHAVWVVAHAGSGAAPPSRRVSAAPAEIASVRISSFGREVVAARGATAVLPCAAVGVDPLRRRWTPPPPPAHSLSDASELLLHDVTESLAGNYTCLVRNEGGADSVTHRLRVLAAPVTPVPRLQRAESHALHIAWDAPLDNSAPVLGYSVVWSRWEGGAEAGRRALPRGEAALVLRGLACGMQYRVTLQAHNALGVSPPSAPLRATTKGDRAVAALGSEFVWANSTALRMNLLAWRARCPTPAYSVALRRPPTPFAPLQHDAESAMAASLVPATWYEVRVVARSSAGDTVALYRAATRAASGERIGEPVLVPLQAQVVEGSAEGAADWRAGAAPVVLAGSVVALIAALTGAAVLRRRRGACGVSREARGARGGLAPVHAQLYSTEPAKRNGKAPPAPSLGPGSLEEISPYATFSMSAGACGEGVECGGAGAGCTLQLRTFGRPAAPPPRPRTRDQRTPRSHTEYREGPRDSDSESSGSACAACELPPSLYGAPAPAAAAHHRRRRPPPPTTVRSAAAAPTPLPRPGRRAAPTTPSPRSFQ